MKTRCPTAKALEQKNFQQQIAPNKKRELVYEDCYYSGLCTFPDCECGTGEGDYGVFG